MTWLNILIIAFAALVLVASVVLLVVMNDNPGGGGPPPPPPRPSPPTHNYAGPEKISSMFAPAVDLSKDCSLSESTSAKDYKKCRLIGKPMNPGYKIKQLQVELDLITAVTSARAADAKSPKGQNLKNPYKIRYSVYNMMLTSAVPLIQKAIKAGVYVQFLIESAQTSPCLREDNSICGKPAGCYNGAIPKLMLIMKDAGITVPTWGGANCLKGTLTNATPGGSLGPPNLHDIKSGAAKSIIMSNKSPNQWAIKTEEQYETFGLIPILSVACEKSFPGIMHTKMRIFEWLDSKGGLHATVMSGSLNPDPSAISNDETLFRIDDSPVCDAYIQVYNSVLHLNSDPANSKYTYVNPTLDLAKNKIQLYFSKGNVAKAGNAFSENTALNIGLNITNLIAAEKELVMIFVYTMTDFGTLIPALRQAAANGAFIFAITDLDQVVGEAGFSQPNFDCLMTEINAIQLDKKYNLDGKPVYIPTYVAKNNNGAHSAFHHKNVLLGIDVMKVITDTSNWTSAAVGFVRGNYDNLPTSGAGSMMVTKANPTGCYGCNCSGDANILCENNKYCDAQGKPTSACKNAQIESYGSSGSGCSAGWGSGNGNCASTVANCDTTLFINSKLLDDNQTGMNFAQVCIYLIRKYWVFTMTSIAQIYHPGQTSKSPYYKGSKGPALGCNPCDTLKVLTGCDGKSSATCGLCGLPAYEPIMNVYSPSQIGKMMLQIPGLKSKNPALYKMVQSLSTCRFNKSASKNYSECETEESFELLPSGV